MRSYFVATLLKNCHECFEHNHTSETFRCPPPSLEDYMRVGGAMP